MNTLFYIQRHFKMLKIWPVIMATKQVAAEFCIPARVIKDSILSRKEVYGFKDSYSLWCLRLFILIQYWKKEIVMKIMQIYDILVWMVCSFVRMPSHFWNPLTLSTRGNLFSTAVPLRSRAADNQSVFSKSVKREKTGHIQHFLNLLAKYLLVFFWDQTWLHEEPSPLIDDCFCRKTPPVFKGCLTSWTCIPFVSTVTDQIQHHLS